MKSLSYTLTPGHPWKRLVMVKDRRTRRPRKLASARANMRLQNSTTDYSIPVRVSYEGGAMMELSYQDTLFLTAGMWDFDLVGDFRGHDEHLATGTIEVQALSTVTPLDSGINMNIEYYLYTDYRKTFKWLDSSDSTLEIADARMQAKDGDGVVVMDIDYAADALSEVEIAALDAANRGYLSPITGASLELHISDQIVVPEGTYTYDILAKESGGDWGRLASGTITVVAGVTTP